MRERGIRSGGPHRRSFAEKSLKEGAWFRRVLCWSGVLSAEKKKAVHGRERGVRKRGIIVGEKEETCPRNKRLC